MYCIQALLRAGKIAVRTHTFLLADSEAYRSIYEENINYKMQYELCARFD